MSEHDIVVRGGRIIDPETGLDVVGDVAITGGRIDAVIEGGSADLHGREEWDAAGQVVAAGVAVAQGALAALADQAVAAHEAEEGGVEDEAARAVVAVGEGQLRQTLADSPAALQGAAEVALAAQADVVLHYDVPEVP